MHADFCLLCSPCTLVRCVLTPLQVRARQQVMQIGSSIREAINEKRTRANPEDMIAIDIYNSFALIRERPRNKKALKRLRMTDMWQLESIRFHLKVVRPNTVGLWSQVFRDALAVYESIMAQARIENSKDLRQQAKAWSAYVLKLASDGPFLTQEPTFEEAQADWDDEDEEDEEAGDGEGGHNGVAEGGASRSVRDSGGGSGAVAGRVRRTQGGLLVHGNEADAFAPGDYVESAPEAGARPSRIPRVTAEQHVADHEHRTARGVSQRGRISSHMRRRGHVAPAGPSSHGDSRDVGNQENMLGIFSD